MSIVNKPDMSYGVWAENGNIEIPSSEKVEEGWVIEKPLNEWMNWLQNRQDKMLAYLNQRGISEWDIRTDYPVNGLVSRSGVIYQAVSQNTDKDPTLNQSIWERAFVSYADFIDYSEKIDGIENTEGYLNLYVSKAFPVMTGIAKGVAYNESTGVSGLSFAGLKPVITNNNNTVVEFGDGTSPRDVVTHEQLALAIQVFKVGSVYTTTVDESPNTTFGYGTWERFGKGKTLVGFTDSVSNDLPEWIKVAGREFGDYTHKLTINEMPSHNHEIYAAGQDSAGNRGLDGADYTGNSPVDNTVMKESGGGLAHNNVQPSIVVYFWKRVA